MAVRTGRWLFLPLALVLLLYIRDLLGQAHGGGEVVEANVRVQIDSPGVLNVLETQLDNFKSPIAIDSNGEPSEERLLSPVLASQPLTFDPPSLDFGEQCIGMPQLATIKVINPSRTQNLHLNSISGDSPDFHPSFFKSKVVKAGEDEWTTFDVVFLPRVAGQVLDTLYIHTSHGTFDFKVEGVGVPNPFRLRSLLGARIPLNATYSPLITMYNPFDTSLQITEMYSSGGDLHLELLSGQPQGSKSLWEIRPYETKPIARANFFGRVAVNHTSFIRVKTSHQQSPSIILPVEVEVSENHGLYLSRELLDFGILKSGESKSLPLFVLNTGPNTVHIKSISVLPDNPAVEIEHTTTILKPGSKYLKVASVTLTSNLVTSRQLQSGRLVILAEDDRRAEYRLEVPFESTVLQGTLSYEKSQTMFRVGKPPFRPMIRNISLSNHFSVPVVLYDVRLSSKAQDYFTVLDFHGPYTLPATSEWHRPFALQFLATSSDCLFNTTLRLSTNASLFNIPFYCYDGRVKYSLSSVENPNEDVLDYGVLSESDAVSKTFLLLNPNPVRITIVSFLVGDSIPFTTAELCRIEPKDMSVEGAEEKVQIVGKMQGAKGPFYVEPDCVAVFRVNITNPRKLGTFTGEILIHTSFDRVSRVPVYYKTAVGSVKIVPDRNIFEPAFPFTISKLPLLARSYYPQTLEIREVRPETPDPRFYYITERTEKIPSLKAHTLTELGTLVFDPLRDNRDNIYLGAGESWSVVENSEQLDAKGDRREFSVLWDVWSSMLDDGLTQFNFSYVILTEIDTSVAVPTEGSLVWPRLYPHKHLQFPRTTIGDTSVQVLTLTNPSRHPVVVQPVFLHQYPQPQKILQVLFESGSLEHLNFSRSESFSIGPDGWSQDTSLTNHLLIPDSDQRRVNISVQFWARDSQPSSTLLIIRNNLTVLECVVIQGRGTEGPFSIDGLQPDSSSLLFQFTPSDLERCEGGTILAEPLKVTKVFRMHNSGPTPIKLTHIGIGRGGACEGGGFVVSNCGREISIQPNKTKRLELSVIPDFTLSRVESTLQLQTDDGLAMTFPLAVLIPHNMLAACHAVQPRPSWEENLVFITAPVWIAIIASVILLALIQTNCGILSPSDDSALPTVQPTGGTCFDFKDLAKTFQDVVREKLESLKKSTTPTTEPVKKSPDEHTTHKPPKVFVPPSPASSHTPSSSRDPEAASDLRQRTTHLETKVNHRPEEERKVEEVKRSEIASGIPRKVERSRYSYDQLLKSEEDAKKTGPSVTPLHPPTTTSLSRKSAEVQVSKPVHVQHILSKATPTDHSPIMTTDHETGMRKFIEQPSPSEHSSHPHDPGSKLKKPQPRSVSASDGSSSSSNVTPTERRSSASSSSAPSAAPAPAPLRKGKGVRRAGAKSMKASPAQGTAKQPSVQTVPMATAPQVRDHFERKESESSLKSTDSESISSASDKSEKEESLTSPAEPSEVQPSPALTKEPGTGQTIPLLLAQEEHILSKGKVSPVTSPAPPVVREASREKEGEKEPARDREQERKEKEKVPLPLLPTPRVRSKKKLKQQQRKEDKLRRREREKDRDRERVREKEKVKQRDYDGTIAEPLPMDAVEVAGKPVISSDGTGERVEQPPVSSAQEQKVGKGAIASPRKAKMSAQNIQWDSSKPVRSKTAPAQVTISPPSSPPLLPTPPPPPPPPPPLPPSPTEPDQLMKDEGTDSDNSPEPEPLSQTWGGSELAQFKESPEPSSPHSQPDMPLSPEKPEESGNTVEQVEGQAQSSHPMEAIPMSALRVMRTRGLKQRKNEEEESGSVASPSSSSAHLPAKKAHGAKRHQEKVPRLSRSSEKTTIPRVSEMAEPAVEPKTAQRKKSAPKPSVEEIVFEITPSPEPMRSESDPNLKSKVPLPAPTSPHEIAANLLSNNPALKKRKVRSDKDRDESDDMDEGQYDEKRKMEEYDIADDGKWEQSDEGSPQKHPAMVLGHHYKPRPLSLDAEPFYPSTDFLPRGKPPKKYHADTPYGSSHGNVPPGFTSEEAGIAFEGKYRSHDHHPPSRPPPPRHHGNTLTPSPPPPYAISADGPPLYYMDSPVVDVPEPSRYSHMHADLSPYDIPPDELAYYPPVGGSGRLVSPGVDVLRDPRGRMLRSSAMYGEDSLLPPQHGGGYAPQRRGSHERHPLSAMSLGSSRSLWDPPSSAYHLTLAKDEEAMIHAHRQRQRQYLMRKYYEEQVAKAQARRSVEAITSINHAPHRPSRSSLYAPEASSPSPWEGGYDTMPDAFPSAHGSDDTFPSESVHAYHLRQQQRQQQLLQEQMSHMRRRTYSGDNDLGGEILPDLLQTPVSPGPSAPSSGLNKAPGTAFSGMEQARAAASPNSNYPRERSLWSENAEPSSGATWSSSIWSLDSPFAATTSQASPSKHPSFPSSDQPSHSHTGAEPPSSEDQSYLANTYDLFKDQSIWGLGNENTSSGLLSWAQLKPTSDPNDPKLNN